MKPGIRLEVADVFGGCTFAKNVGGNYPAPSGWYPLLGLPGSLDIREGAVLFCKLQTAVEAEVQKFCLNGVIDKIRVHRSARVNGPDTMRVFASDLIHEFEVCIVPKVTDVANLLSGIRKGTGYKFGAEIPSDFSQTQIPAGKIQAYLKTDYRFSEGLDAITLHVDLRSVELARIYASFSVACGVFITAHNPWGESQSDEANDVANESLAAELAAASTKVFEGAGADPSGDWPAEKSFFALGIDLDAARSLGTRYKQDAVVWIGADAVPKLILLR
jgi:Protein of unknown function (DUF3293)